MRSFDWTEKPWGRTQAVTEGPLMSCHHIFIEEGGFCSYHKHERKWNAFVVVTGFLTIIEDGAEIVLGPGDYHACPPGAQHRFVAEKPVEAYEWYWPDVVDPKDIIRKGHSGRVHNG